MKALRFIVLLLMVIGSLNWGLIGFFGYDMLSDLLGGMRTSGARILFSIVGLAGLFGVGMLFRCCCRSGGCGCHKCGPNCHCNCHRKE